MELDSDSGSNWTQISDESGQSFWTGSEQAKKFKVYLEDFYLIIFEEAYPNEQEVDYAKHPRNLAFNKSRYFKQSTDC